MRLLLLAALLCCTLHAQDGLFSNWFDRSDQAKSDQPHWMTPLFTVTPRLEQEFRTDFLVEPMPTGDDLVNFDNSKGLELIPCERVEVIFNVPPYLEHNNPKIHDGFGDVSFLGKYRLLQATRRMETTFLRSFSRPPLPRAPIAMARKAE